MFASTTTPGIDLAQLIQMYGPQGGLSVPQTASGPTGMASSFPSAPPAGMFGSVGRTAPVNSVSMPNGPAARFGGFQPPPPDQLLGTNPIGTDLQQPLPNDPRVDKAMAPRFFENGGLGQKLAMALGPALMAAGGNHAAATQMIGNFQRQKEWTAEQARQRLQDRIEADKWKWQQRKDTRPDIRTVNGQIVAVPFEGDPTVIHQAPTDAEQYATTLGLQPGDEGYADAVMDYTLRSNGPTAYEQRSQLEDQRYGNRVNLRGMPTYANLHPRTGGRGGGANGAPRIPRSVNEAVAPILAKLSRGQQLTPAEQQALSYYNRGGRGSGKPLAIKPSITPRPAAPRLPMKQAGPVRVSTPEEARRLKPGTQFVTPDGKVKVR
ncbi:MAG: hypothetical protein AB7G25_04575 [Sphingomonadaceae bacterium]